MTDRQSRLQQKDSQTRSTPLPNQLQTRPFTNQEHIAAGQEASDLSDQLQSTQQVGHSFTSIQMKQQPLLQRSHQSEVASSDLEQSIEQNRGNGQPIADSIRQPMEQAFGTDFSRVKIHTNGESDRLNRSIRAKAFTTGQDVFFRQGAYAPESRSGQELLAHELTHVVQQNGLTVQAKAASSPMLQMKSTIPSKKDFHEATKDHYVMLRDGFLEDIDQWLELFSELNDEFEKETKPSERLETSKLLIDLLQELEEVIENGLKAAKDTEKTVGVLENIKKQVLSERQQKEEVRKKLQESHQDDSALELQPKDGKSQAQHKGSAKSLFTKVAGIIKTAVPNPGDSKELDYSIQFPVAAGTFIGGRFFANAQHLENDKYRIRCEITITASANFKIADLNAGIGGYLEVQADNPEKCLELVSYAFYRRLVESKCIPVEASNYIWGGTTRDIGYKIAERWAGRVEKDNFGDNSGNQKNSYVETGALAEVSGQVGVDGMNVNAGIKASSGSRIDKHSIQVNRLVAEFGLDPSQAIQLVKDLNEQGPQRVIDTKKDYESIFDRGDTRLKRIMAEVEVKGKDAFLGVSHNYTGRGDAQRSMARGVTQVESWVAIDLPGLSGGCNCTAKWATNNAGEDYTFRELSLNAHLSAELPKNGVTEFISNAIEGISKAASEAKSKKQEADGKSLPANSDKVDLNSDSTALTNSLKDVKLEGEGIQLQASYSLLYHPAEKSGDAGTTAHQIMVTYSSSSSSTILFSASKSLGDESWKFSSFGVDLANLSPSEQLFKEFLDLNQELNKLRELAPDKGNPYREAEIVEQISALLKEQEITNLLTKLPDNSNSTGKATLQDQFIDGLSSLLPNKGDLNLKTVLTYLEEQKTGLENRIKENLQDQLAKGMKLGSSAVGKALEVAIPEIGSLKGVFNTLKQAMQLEPPSTSEISEENSKKFTLKVGKIPLGDLGNIPIQINGTAQYTSDKQYKLRCNLSVSGAPSFLSKLQTELGGYAEVQAANVEQANDLMSYAFYRRLVESKYIPVEISNYLWGGTAMSAGYARAEQWAGQVEKDAFAKSESNPNASKAYVETGIYGAANFKSGDQQVAGEMRSGGRYDSESIQVNKLAGEFGISASTAKAFIAEIYKPGTDLKDETTVKGILRSTCLGLEEEKETAIANEVMTNGTNAFLGMTHIYKERGDTQRKVSRDVSNLEIAAQVKTEQLAGTLKGLVNWQKDVTGEGERNLRNISLGGTVAGTVPVPKKLKEMIQGVEQSRIEGKIKDVANDLVTKLKDVAGEVVNSACKLCEDVAAQPLAANIKKEIMNLASQIAEQAQRCVKEVENCKDKIISAIQQLVSTLQQFSEGVPVKLDYTMSYCPSNTGKPVGDVTYTLSLTCLDNRTILTLTNTAATKEKEGLLSRLF